ACVADGAEIAGRCHRLGHAAALENHPTLNPTTEHCGDLTTLTKDKVKRVVQEEERSKPQLRYNSSPGDETNEAGKYGK
ncbi:hypothetical protein ACMV5I_28595, partial [Serratia sp. T13T92]|uniref:hypothetical protein n=1 Tax=Serratia sp. T13T92 TaxID=3397496 RepID=UPI0039E09B70